jgi:YhcH/YjgK/YiaL family protein
MILAPLAHLGRYAGLHPLFPRALAAAADPAVRALPDGRHALQGDDLFVIVERLPTRARAEKRLECHRRYIDIQVLLAGAEAMECTDVDGLDIAADFAPGGDVRFFREPARPLTRLLVTAGQAAVFFPEDAHKPGCHPGDGPVLGHKLVFKVALQPAG